MEIVEDKRAFVILRGTYPKFFHNELEKAGYNFHAIELKKTAAKGSEEASEIMETTYVSWFSVLHKDDIPAVRARLKEIKGLPAHLAYVGKFKSDIIVEGK